MNVTYRLQDDARLPAIAPQAIRYLKLGVGGEFARACFDGGYIGMGFDEQSHADCLAGAWDRVRQDFRDRGKTPSKATAHANELRDFYTLGPETLWVTFAEARLWWTFAEAQVEFHDDLRLPRRRRTIGGGWRATDINGAPLRFRDLSTALTSIKAFRGTCCEVKAGDYLVRRINAIEEPLAAEASLLKAQTLDLVKRLMAVLHWRDFEIMVDLIFSASGWRRVGVLGETEVDLDLLLQQAATGERAFVQVKSRAGPAVLADYLNRFEAHACERMFFICHSPSPGLANAAPSDDRVALWFGDALAEQVMRAGLLDWLVQRIR